MLCSITGKHDRRAINTHKCTLVALHECYLKEFFKEHPCPELNYLMVELQAKSLEKDNIHKLIGTLEKCKMLEKMKKFDDERQSNATFKMVRRYMSMVESFSHLIRSIRSGN